MSVSLCIIARDEEKVLRRCLESAAHLVDEIIIVDTGSTDQTMDIAKEYTVGIYSLKWEDNFAKARNFAFSKATKDYILWLDADDVFMEEDQLKFQKLKQGLDPDTDSVLMNYHLSFDQNNNHPLHSTVRNRLVKRSREFRWVGAVHEYLEVSGVIVSSNVAITHKKEKKHTDRNLKIFRKLEQEDGLSVRDWFYFANELVDHGYLEEALEKYEHYLQTKEGWLEDKITACIKRADIFGTLYQREEQISSLLYSFLFDTPRAEVCCRLGLIFLELKRLDQAVYWYEKAVGLSESPQITGLHHDPAAWSWLPHLQLCVCFDQMGKQTKALAHHKIASSLNSSHPSVVMNEQYFTAWLK